MNGTAAVPGIARRPLRIVLGYQPFHLLVIDDLAAAGPIAFWDIVDQRPDMKRPWSLRLDSRRGAHRGMHLGSMSLFLVLRQCAFERGYLHPESRCARPAAPYR